MKPPPGKLLRADVFSRKKKAMNTSKILLVSCVVAVLSAQALMAAKPETEAQAKMREALRLKIEELNTQQPAPESAVVVAPVVETPKVETKPAPKPEVKKPKAVEVKKEVTKSKTVVVPVPAEPAAKVVVSPITAPAKAEFSEPAPAPDSAAAARMREALEAKMKELNAAATVVTPAPVVAPKPVVATKPVVVVAPAAPATPAAVVVAVPAPTIIEAPASPLPATKQDKLADLLRRYKSDEISALDYHGKRAAILAE